MQATCPDIVELTRLFLGQLEVDEIAGLQIHLANCSQCLATINGLRNDDPLIWAIQSQSGIVGAEDEVVERLIERLCDPSGPTQCSHSAWTPSGTLVELRGLLPTDDGCSPEDYSFLSPSPRAGELGRLGPYGINRELGRGGMGIVFEAEDPHLERQSGPQSHETQLSDLP